MLEKIKLDKNKLDKVTKYWKIALIVLIFFHIFLLVGLKFIAWPEMTFWPYLILKGWLPYKDIAIAHNPFLLVELSIFYRIVGVGLLQLKIYTYILIITLDLVLFFVARELWDKRVALLALIFYIPLQVIYEGNGLWFDLYLTLPILISFYFLQKKQYVSAGMFWALAFLTKQTAVWLLIPITIYTLQGRTLQGMFDKIQKLALGGMVVLIPFMFIVWKLGILPNYFFWAYEFGTRILPTSSGQVHAPAIRQVLVALFPFSIFLILLVNKRMRRYSYLALWSIFGFFGAFPRWELFHFQQALPFLAIFIAIVFIKLGNEKIFKYVLFVFTILLLLISSGVLIRDWGQEDRFYDSGLLKVANYVDNKTEDGSQIFILNAWDSVYSLSNTLPAVRPWIPHLSWYMELEGVQEEMVNDLEISKPSVVVMKPFAPKGLSSYQPEMIVEFLNNSYQQEDIIEGYLILELNK